MEGLKEDQTVIQGLWMWKHFGFTSRIFQPTFKIKQTNVIIRRVQIEMLVELHYLLLNLVFNY